MSVYFTDCPTTSDSGEKKETEVGNTSLDLFANQTMYKLKKVETKQAKGQIDHYGL